MNFNSLRAQMLQGLNTLNAGKRPGCGFHWNVVLGGSGTESQQLPLLYGPNASRWPRAPGPTPDTVSPVPSHTRPRAATCERPATTQVHTGYLSPDAAARSEGVKAVRKGDESFERRFLLF